MSWHRQEYESEIKVVGHAAEAALARDRFEGRIEHGRAAASAVAEAVARERQDFEDAEAHRNQLASSMTLTEDRSLIEKFVQERKRIEEHAQHTALRHIETAEREANRRLVASGDAARREVQEIQWQAERELSLIHI